MKQLMIMLILMCTALFAAEYGRIIGRVVDAETGDPLIGADVIVEGTDLGAATDEKGEYTVLYVTAGTYQVVASYISYDPFTYASVVVNADQTTQLNFRLRPTVIEVQGVTAVAERPLIVVSQTQTGRAVTSQEMDRLPVTTINQVITLQAGVVQSDLGTHFRGGRTNEVTQYIDGIATKVPNTGQQSVNINPSAVEEITVVSGGFDAEYGDALSGVVQIVTKEGGTKHAGNFRYLTDEILSSVDQLHYGYNLYDVSIGGPFPLTNRFRYFLSGELMTNDAFQAAYYKVPSPRMDYRAQARFSYLFPNAKGKLTLSGFNSREQFVVWGTAQNAPNNLKYFPNKPMQRTKNWIASATMNYMLTAKTLMSAKFGATQYNRCFGNRDYEWEENNDRQWHEDYRFRAEHIIDYLMKGDLSVRDVIIDSVMQYHSEWQNRDRIALRSSPYATEGLFYTSGDHRVWRYWYNRDYQARFDATHSIGRVHEFRSGVDFTQYDMKFYDNNLPWVTNPFWDYYNRSPYKIAWYLQDKMDFEGLIARIGVRIDYFDPKALTFENPTDVRDTSTIKADVSYKISPRLGFSLPVTDRMKFRFNYGHYFQLPILSNMYTSNDTAVIKLALSRGNTIIGNILMRPEKTVMYEVGIENQFSDQVVAGLTAYFKDIYDLSQIREVPALPTPYFQFFNVDYGNVKGFEFSLRKRMADMWAISAVYTLQFAKGTASFAGEWYNDYYNWQIEPPVIDYWLDFDERHTVNINFDIETPKDFFFIPMQNFNSSIVFSYHSGQPYTPQDLRGNQIGDQNSARMEGYFNVDLNVSRQIALGPVNIVLSGMITNLFNTTQLNFVYPTTGRADAHGDPEPLLSQFGNIPHTSSRYSPQADLNHDGFINPSEQKLDYMAATIDYYDNPLFYNNPLNVRVGVGLSF